MDGAVERKGCTIVVVERNPAAEAAPNVETVIGSEDERRADRDLILGGQLRRSHVRLTSSGPPGRGSGKAVSIPICDRPAGSCFVERILVRMMMKRLYS